jgi:hypothetical protein
MSATETIPESPAPGLPAPENLAGFEPTRPADYVAINAIYGVLLAGLIVAARGQEDEARRIIGPELLPLGAATFALSKVIAREKIGTWLREPFVEEGAGHGSRPRGRRLRHAIGELVTCTRCVGAWSALGIVGLRLTSPTTGRVVTGVLATSAVNDLLQATFRALCDTANAEAKRAAA